SLSRCVADDARGTPPVTLLTDLQTGEGSDLIRLQRIRIGSEVVAHPFPSRLPATYLGIDPLDCDAREVGWKLERERTLVVGVPVGHRWEGEVTLARRSGVRRACGRRG